MIGKCMIFVSLMAFYFVNANHYHEAFEKISKKCANEVGIDPENLTILFKRSRNNPDEKYKCFLKCFMQEFGSMDSEGNILDSLDFHELPYPYGQLKDECIEISAAEDDICERAYSFHSCFMSKAHDLEEAY